MASNQHSWIETPAEKVLKKFPEALFEVTPKHKNWIDRVKIEILNLTKYVEFLQKNGGRSWFELVPNKNSRLQYLIWEGHIQVPTRIDIRFDFAIILPSGYPKACPRAFAEESIVEYAGKVFPKNIWTSPSGKKFVMICHDHMESVDRAWDPSLTIAHFFIREVFYWWAAQQNLIIDEWDKRNNL